jgi:hypothetical protein
MIPVAPHLTAFLQQRLPVERGASITGRFLPERQTTLPPTLTVNKHARLRLKCHVVESQSDKFETRNVPPASTLRHCRSFPVRHGVNRWPSLREIRRALRAIAL